MDILALWMLLGIVGIALLLLMSRIRRLNRMLIEIVQPAVVAKKSRLRKQLFSQAKACGAPKNCASEIISAVPKRLLNARAFRDSLTGLWRYEFGLPYEISDDLLWGTYMWPPVKDLYSALRCAYSRLSSPERTQFLERLADQNEHLSAFAEMIPADKIDSEVPLSFEVPGMGVGNRTVDWVIGPLGNRTILLDVKRRTTDLIQQMERLGDGGVAPEPNHDPALLFRSVEDKFIRADPNVCLQGGWIVTDIKQQEDELERAFCALDESKVHFVVIGDWRPDIYTLVRRHQDAQYLLDLFHAERSTRFTYIRRVEE